MLALGLAAIVHYAAAVPLGAHYANSTTLSPSDPRIKYAHKTRLGASSAHA